MLAFPKGRPRRLEKLEAQRARVKEWTRLRALVWGRDSYLCRVCQKARPYDLHHLLARSLGGRDELMNLIAVCRRCHEDITGHVVRVRWADDTNRAKRITIERAL
jgi:5-methylcytosine-specific restriction endonuclease McrA